MEFKYFYPSKTYKSKLGISCKLKRYFNKNVSIFIRIPLALGRRRHRIPALPVYPSALHPATNPSLLQPELLLPRRQFHRLRWVRHHPKEKIH